MIGKKARHVKAADWKEYVFGYTIVNDVSARDVQMAEARQLMTSGARLTITTLARLIADGIATEQSLLAMEQQIEADIDEAVEFALGSSFPDVDELRRDVFAQEIAA